MSEKLIQKYNIRLNSDKTKLIVDSKIGNSKNDSNYVKEHRAEIIEILLDKEAKEEQALQAYRDKLKSVEGLTELQLAIADWNSYNRSMSRYIERDCIGTAPVKPTYTVEELADKYPRAAAFVKADNWSYSAHYFKSLCGEKAKAAILEGGNYKDIISDMVSAWKQYTDEHIFD